MWSCIKLKYPDFNLKDELMAYFLNLQFLAGHSPRVFIYSPENSARGCRDKDGFSTSVAELVRVHMSAKDNVVPSSRQNTCQKSTNIVYRLILSSH